MRVWIYCRIASRNGMTDEFCQLQRMRLQRYAADNGWKVVGASCEITKGFGLDRPGLKAAEDAVRLGLADRVLVLQLDRISRKNSEMWTWIEMLRRWGGELISANEMEMDLFSLDEQINNYFRKK